MNVLMFTDGIFNDYKRFDEFSLENSNIFVWTQKTDKNKMGAFVKEKYQNVKIVKNEEDIKDCNFDKILILRIGKELETPFSKLKDNFDISEEKIEYIISTQKPKYFRNAEPAIPITKQFEDFGIKDPFNTEKNKKLNKRMKKMKTKTSNKKKSIRVTLKIKKKPETLLAIESYE